MRWLRTFLASLMIGVGMYLFGGVAFIVALTGIFYIPLSFEGVLAIVAMWTAVGVFIRERIPAEMSLPDYLNSDESIVPVILFWGIYVVLILMWGVREIATEDASQPFKWKGSEIYGFLVVGAGAFLSGFLIDSVMRRKDRTEDKPSE